MNGKHTTAAWVLVATGFLGLWSAANCSEGYAATDETAGVAQEVAVAPELETLNLWTRTGRPRTFVDSKTRQALQAIDIVDRPNRLLHFYGNAVRRRANGAASGIMR